MKLSKRERTAMEDRIKWLKCWLKERNCNIGDYRNTYLYIYYSTIRVLYSKQLCHDLIHDINSSFKNPLPADNVDAITFNVERKGAPSRYRNQDIISKLGITEREVDMLQIGRNQKVIQERARKKELKQQWYEDIDFLYDIGLAADEIAKKYVGRISKRTIQRHLAKLRRESMVCQEKDALSSEVIALYGDNYSILGIARKMGISVKEVRNILNLDSMTNLTIQEIKRDEIESQEFKASECREFFRFSLYKEESTQSCINEHDIALASLKTDFSNYAIFGTAGTGKSTLIRNYLSSLSLQERAATLVVAPTGRAADHLNAQTIHKAFQLPNEVQPNDEVIVVPEALYHISRIIIDEINMVRVDIFTKIIKTLRFVEEQTSKHIQVIVLGDFGQIQPVTTDEDYEALRLYYPEAKGVYAFHSEIWDQMDFRTIILKKIHRQIDPEFIEKLNEIKYGKLSALEWFNKNANPICKSNGIYICPTNKMVDYYNQQAINEYSPDKLVDFDAVISKEVPSDIELPCPIQLRLAVGMRIMTICNTDKFKNGSMGCIDKINQSSIKVKFDSGKTITVSAMRFVLDNGVIYEQLPIVLAYGMTANKCEGMTLEAINVVPGYFAPGQLYTALSRCTNLQNIHIVGELSERDLIVDVEALQMTVDSTDKGL